MSHNSEHPCLCSLSKLLRPPCDARQHFCDLEQWPVPGSSLTILSPYPIGASCLESSLLPRLLLDLVLCFQLQRPDKTCLLSDPFSLDGTNKFSFVFRSLFYSLTGLLASSCEEPTHWKRPWCWKRLKAGGERDDRGWGGWMASLLWWAWVWASSRRGWWTGEPGMLQSMVAESRTRLRDWTTMIYIYTTPFPWKDAACVCFQTLKQPPSGVFLDHLPELKRQTTVILRHRPCLHHHPHPTGPLKSALTSVCLHIPRPQPLCLCLLQWIHTSN